MPRREEAKSHRRRHKATFEIKIPSSRRGSNSPVEKDVCWYNFHYKRMHEWRGGHVEVEIIPGLRGYDKLRKSKRDASSSSSEEPIDPIVRFPCPYCKKRCEFHVESIDRVKGHIWCPFCRKSYGINPNGQAYVVRGCYRCPKTNSLFIVSPNGEMRPYSDIPQKDAAAQKDKMMKWVNDETHYLEAHVLPPRNSDDFVEIEIEWLGDESSNDKPHPTLIDFREFQRSLVASGYEFRRLS